MFNVTAHPNTASGCSETTPAQVMYEATYSNGSSFASTNIFSINPTNGDITVSSKAGTGTTYITVYGFVPSNMQKIGILIGVGGKKNTAGPSFSSDPLPQIVMWKHSLTY